MSSEEWRPTHHPDYEVSNLGRIRSFAHKTVRILVWRYDRHGYPRVSFGRQEPNVFIHRLVAAAFIGPCPVGQEVRHKNDVVNDPCSTNLEYGTRHDNIMDSVKRGRWNRPRKLTVQQANIVRLSKARGIDIARQFGVSPQHVCSLRKGRR